MSYIIIKAYFIDNTIYVFYLCLKLFLPLFGISGENFDSNGLAGGHLSFEDRSKCSLAYQRREITGCFLQIPESTHQNNIYLRRTYNTKKSRYNIINPSRLNQLNTVKQDPYISLQEKCNLYQSRDS